MKKYLISFVVLFIVLICSSYIFLQYEKNDKISKYLTNKTIEYNHSYNLIKKYQKSINSLDNNTFLIETFKKEYNSTAAFLNNHKNLSLTKELIFQIEQKQKKYPTFSIYDKVNNKAITAITIQNSINKDIFLIQSEANYIVNKNTNTNVLFCLLIGISFFVLLTVYKLIEQQKKHSIEMIKEIKRNNKLKKLNKKVYSTQEEIININKNLTKIVEERTREGSKNLRILSRYVIFSKTDLKGIITEASDAFCKISGYSKDELIGKPHNILRHHDMPSEAFKEMWETIKKGTVWRGEVKNRLKDDGYYWVSANISPEFDKDKNIIGYMSIRQDITARKDFEEQHLKLVKSERMASMGEMIVNIAHQWRQPLSVISTGVTSMQIQKEFDMLSDEKFNETCEMINKNAQHLSKTIDEFKSFAQGEKVLELFDLKDNANSFLQIAHKQLEENNIEVVCNIQEDIKINAYPNELTQAYVNILNNTIDALKTKDIKNKYLFLDISKENEKISIQLKDNAGGIPADIIEKIFEPYFTTKHQSQCTGLGLHMVNDLIANVMGGKIEVQNETYTYKDTEYTGVKFTFTIS
ncbi:MAG TPA: PAS domain S-box protein [Arcobacter sp.]|nr:PAS domain S-box protein [Arcobacter sp.]